MGHHQGCEHFSHDLTILFIGDQPGTCCLSACVLKHRLQRTDVMSLKIRIGLTQCRSWGHSFGDWENAHSMESVGSLGGFQICLRYMHFDVKIWQEIGISDGLVLSSFVCHMFSCLDGSVCSEASDPFTSFLPGWQRRISRGWKWDSARRVERDNYGYSYTS